MEKEITSYDYKTIRVRRQLEVVVTDAYEALGWEGVGSSVSEGGINHVNLSFKRDRKIENKTNLLKMQEKIDSTILNIESLIQSKKSAGVATGVTVGTIGVLTFGGGMSMVMELGATAIGYMIGGIAIGIVGIGVCLLGWLFGKNAKRKKSNKIDTILEQEYNKLADLCDEAKKL